MQDHRLGLLLVVVIYIFSPVVLDWWAMPEIEWYRPYILWVLLLLFYIWFNSRRRS